MIHDALIFLLNLLVVHFQNSIWPEIFGEYFPLYLWIPCLIYWLLYRSTWQAGIWIYIFSLWMAANSTILLSHFLMLLALMFLVILFFQRVYYTSLNFFSTACAVSLLCFPCLSWLLSIWLEGYFYFPPLLSWIGGGMVSWILSFPLFFLFTWIDHLQIKKTPKAI